MANERTMILGGGSLGRALAEGFLRTGALEASQLVVTRRRVELLGALEQQGVEVTSDNRAAVRGAKTILLTVEPGHVDEILREIAPDLDGSRHVLVSCASGVGVEDLREATGGSVPIVLAMPNTAVAVGASMTCLSSRDVAGEHLDGIAALFASVGAVEVVPEELMEAATVLGACGIAYALRFVRAASQGGTEIGFDAATSRRIASQTAFGAAKLLLEREQHPEREIDRVTTPRGCTIAGLNEMEHRGFSSALIKGVTTSYRRIAPAEDGA